jgi:hypothetical protein
MSTTPRPTTIGGLPPPDGVIPNFEHPYTIAGEIKVLVIVFMVLVVITTVIRAYTKLRILRTHGWDDCGFLDGSFGR